MKSIAPGLTVECTLFLYSRASIAIYCKWVIDSGCVGLPGYSDWISFSAHPTLFLINLAVSILITIVFVPLLALGFWGWRAEQRNLQRRESLPRLDTSIRESIDR
jgi:uncharacterized membrane protein YidH (DUF202 family)